MHIKKRKSKYVVHQTGAEKEFVQSFVCEHECDAKKYQ